MRLLNVAQWLSGSVAQWLNWIEQPPPKGSIKLLEVTLSFWFYVILLLFSM